MIEVHLYGRLRRYGPTQEATTPCVLRVEPHPEHRTVGDLVTSLGIPPEAVASVFSDGRWRQEGVNAPLGETTRLGLFPPNMSLLYV
ncbi:MAG: hypothetical protein ACM3US_00315 [Sphingomonadaceae bacterium]